MGTGIYSAVTQCSSCSYTQSSPGTRRLCARPPNASPRPHSYPAAALPPGVGPGSSAQEWRQGHSLHLRVQASRRLPGHPAISVWPRQSGAQGGVLQATSGKMILAGRMSSRSGGRCSGGGRQVAALHPTPGIRRVLTNGPTAWASGGTGFSLLFPHTWRLGVIGLCAVGLGLPVLGTEGQHSPWLASLPVQETQGQHRRLWGGADSSHGPSAPRSAAGVRSYTATAVFFREGQARPPVTMPLDGPCLPPSRPPWWQSVRGPGPSIPQWGWGSRHMSSQRPAFPSYLAPGAHTCPWCVFFVPFCAGGRG